LAQSVYNKFGLIMEDHEKVAWVESMPKTEYPDVTRCKEFSVEKIIGMLARKVQAEGLEVIDNNGVIEFKRP
jgi:hypothetical protein